jgi:hypothetical protein
LLFSAGCGGEEQTPPAWAPPTAGQDEDEDEPTDGEDDDADEDEDEDDGDGGSTSSSPDDDGSTSGAASGPETSSGEEESTTGPPVDPPPYTPLYRIEVRVHWGNSELGQDELESYLAEMNTIWRDQAGICFEFTVVEHTELMTTGFDVNFQPEVGGPNGYYSGDHDIWCRDYPSLGAAPEPAMYGGARTCAHELGHGLTLDHDQGSDNYLMRSGTLGFEIPQYQIDAARVRAEEKALPDTEPLVCGAPVFD